MISQRPKKSSELFLNNVALILRELFVDQFTFKKARGKMSISSRNFRLNWIQPFITDGAILPAQIACWCWWKLATGENVVFIESNRVERKTSTCRVPAEFFPFNIVIPRSFDITSFSNVNINYLISFYFLRFFVFQNTRMVRNTCFVSKCFWKNKRLCDRSLK